MREEKLQVSSFQSMGGCDGPSLRSVIFLYGCPLRCDYCHNPETWYGEDYTWVSVEEMAQKVLRNKPYFRRGGGVTVSGGEPLLQQERVCALFQRLKAEGVHTCIDTSGSQIVQDALFAVTDLFLLDVKFLSSEAYLKYTKCDIFPHVKRLLMETKERNIPIWIRHVLYPNVTDSPEFIENLLDFLEPFPHIQRIDLLPFRSLCITKYEKFSLDFPMKHVCETTVESLAQRREQVELRFRQGVFMNVGES